MKRIICLYLDILSLPTLFLNKEENAKFHLKYICPRCPKFRIKLRDVENKGDCWWHYCWKNGRYDIPRSFGFINWLKQYIFLKTNLHYYRKKFIS